MKELWLRHYAAKILAAPTKEQRRKLLDDVPDHLRNWVQKIVVDEFERRKIVSGKKNKADM